MAESVEVLVYLNPLGSVKAEDSNLIGSKPVEKVINDLGSLSNFLGIVKGSPLSSCPPSTIHKL